MTRVLPTFGEIWSRHCRRLSSRLDGVEGSRFRSFTVLGLVARTPGWLAGGWETPSAADSLRAGAGRSRPSSVCKPDRCLAYSSSIVTTVLGVARSPTHGAELDSDASGLL